MPRERRTTKRPQLMLEQLEERQLLASVGPNVNISRMFGNQAGATIAVDQTDPQRMFAASSTETGTGLFAATSTDGGATWATRLMANGFDGLPTACCDPSASGTFDIFGNLFLAYQNDALGAIEVAISADGGQTFSSLTTFAGTGTQPTVVTGPGSVWVTWNEGTIRAAGAPVTGLGAALVGPFTPVQAAGAGNFGDIAIGPLGQVIVAYQNPAGNEGPSNISVNVDPDGLGPLTFGANINVTNTNVGGCDVIPAQSGFAATRLCIGVNAAVSLAWDRTGGPNDGRIYLVYTNEAPAESNNTNVFLRISDNDGATWSFPRQVNDDLTTRSQFLPRVAIDQNTGDVGVVWYDARNDAGTGGTGDTNGIPNDDAQLWGTLSTDGGTTFEPNVQISEGTSNADSAFSAVDYGDYLGLDFVGGNFFPVWADNSNSTGNNPNGALGELDIYTAAVSVLDTVGPRVIATVPIDGAVVNGTVSFIDFTFNEPMDTTSFNFVDNPVTLLENEDDVVSFTGPGGIDLKPDITGFNWLFGGTVLRLNFLTQGAPGSYSITIGPNITDVALNPMDQDQDGVNGESPAPPFDPGDTFTMGFSIPTPKVTSVRVLANSVVVTFNKDLDQSTLTGHVFVERSGGDQVFGNANDVIEADSTTATYDALTFTLTFPLPFFPADDLWRVRLEDMTTDAFGNPLDGEFDGPPPAGNGNQFPSGNDSVLGDFLYSFFFGGAPVPVAPLPALERIDNPICGPAGSFSPCDVSNAGNQRNESQPSIVVDPTDPTKLVATYQIVEQNPSLCNVGFRGNEAITRCVAYSFSTDGGATWSFGNVLPIPRNPNTVTSTDPGQAFLGAVTPSVAFDGNHNFYVVYSVVTPVDNPVDNAILMRKFDFSGAAPFADFSADHTSCRTALYCGAGSATDDVARNPVIAANTNPASFTDPDTGIVFTDPDIALGQVPVYVMWQVQRQGRPNGPGSFNPEAIVFSASADGGIGFSAPFNVNGSGFGDTSGFTGSDRNLLPQLAVAGALPELSPGVPDPNSGRVHIVWDERGTGGAFDNLQYDRLMNDVTDNDTRGLGTSQRSLGASAIFDSFTTISSITVTDDFVISDVNLDLRVDHPDLRDVTIQLRSPTGSVSTIVALGGGTALPNLGSNVPSSDAIGTKIDDEAVTGLQAGTAPWQFGEYRPSTALSVFDGEQSAGTWTLQITDFSGTSTTPIGFLFNWGLQISGDIGQDSFGIDQTIASTRLKANNPLQAPAAGASGVTMAPVIAIDKTLGSFSPHQGNIYVAYVERPTGAGNDTDICMVRSTDAGNSFFGANPNGVFFCSGSFGGTINDDHTNEVSTGVRTQFQPAIAVDDVTGTVVVSWLDARNDAANSRVATYVSASTDGGESFSANEFVNRPQLENDNLDPRQRCIACINLGPIPDNQSAGNPVRDTNEGFGDHQGLAVMGGRVFAAWSSNENQRDDTNGNRRLDIRVAQATIAAGPRIVNASMGPIVGGVSSFTVAFDRPVDPSTFTIGSGGSAPIFQATFDAGNNGFTFDNRGPDNTAATADDGLWHRSTGRGTNPGHSPNNSMYYGRNEGPNGGGDYNTNPGGVGNSGFLTSPPIDLTSVTGPLNLSFNYFLETEGGGFFDAAQVEISTDGGFSFSPLTDNTFFGGLSDPTAGFESFSADISAFTGFTVLVRFSFNTGDGILNNFEGWYVDDVTIAAPPSPDDDVMLIARDEFGVPLPPALHPTLQSIDPSNCNQFGCSTFTVNFTASVEVGTYSYVVGPFINDRIRVIDDLGNLISLGNQMDQNGNGVSAEFPADQLAVPRTPDDTATMPIVVPGPHVVDSHAGVEYPQSEFPAPVAIPDGGTVTSSFTITDRYPITDLDVLLNITHTFDQDLTVQLIHTDRLGCVTTVTLFSGVGASGDNFTRTILDDTGASGPIGLGAAPFTGSFIPQNSLDVFEANLANPPACGATGPTGGNIEGVWTLAVTDAAGNGVGTLDSWSLLVNPDPATDPLQENLVLNGTVSYFDVMFDQPMDPTTFKTEDVQRIIGPAGLIGPRPQDTFTFPNMDAVTDQPLDNIPDGVGMLTSTLTIARSELIHDLNVQLDITHPNVSDLTVRLTSPDPDGPGGPATPITVTLASLVGGAGDNFVHTIFDDEQPSAVSSGVAPFAGRYQPQQSLSAFDGINIQGTWTLEVIDSVSGNAGRLENWSMSLDRFTVTPNPLGTDADPNFPTTYRISFPRQTLSGTYQLTLGPNIFSQRLNPMGQPLAMDQNLDAGLKASRGVDPAPKTFSTTLSTPRPTITNDSVPLLSSIVIDDNFIVRDVDVQIDISHLNVSDIRAFLVFTPPNGTSTRVELFTGVGGTGNNFSGTIIDDEAVFVNNAPRVIGAAGTSAPFLGRFRPEQFNSALPGTRLSDFDGKNSRGTWTLEISDSANNAFVGTLESWSLTFQATSNNEPTLDFDQTGLGNLAADGFGGSFRIFVMDQTDVRATSVWTGVGPAAIGTNGANGRTGAIAVDPSDPSGNTVYAGGATGGVWKTSNFLTTDPDGPIWMPLTDFGPTYSLNIGSIALFPRNDDPNQTIVYVATGEGDGLFGNNPAPGGTGFLKSMDGGATWRLLDSLDNRPAFSARTHDFNGSTAFKIVVDYTNPDVVYAALATSGAIDPNIPGDTGGGVWRSFDGGLTWTRTRVGFATDLAIDPVNPEVLYAGFMGEGVYRTPDKGFRWDQLVGGVGNPQFVDGDVANFPSITVNAPTASPNGAFGRISLAKPPTNDPTYQGWVYALVANTDGSTQGIYQSKDFGQNWTRLNLPGLGTLPRPRPNPTNDESQINVDALCNANRCQGQYDQSIAVDAVNPSVVYIGGNSNPVLIRIDTTRTYDAHAVVAFDHDNADGGQPGPTAQESGVTRKNTASTGAFAPPAPDIGPFTFNGACEANFVPVVRGYNVFSGCQSNVASIRNTGEETTWQVVTLGEHVDHHDIFTMVDPVTGKSRLIVGTDGGFWTGVDDEVEDFDGALSTATGIGTAQVGGGSRNGNMQITQYFYGAVQPSQLAADVSGTLFFGNSADNGLAISGPNVLLDGQYGNYGSIGGDGGGVATDPTGTGLFYAYFWPCCSFSALQQEFFFVSDVDPGTPGFQGGPQVNGLFQFGGINVEWPRLGPLYGANFAVNPRDGQQLAISSATGRVYKIDRASDPFAAWFQIGDPAIFGNSQSFALAYGAAAPDPDPNDSQQPDEILYVGTSTGPNPGRVLVTFTEGGFNGTEWFDISCSERSVAAMQVTCDMDGAGFSSVRQIVTNLKEGSKEAFAVTHTGVYHLPDAAAAVADVVATGSNMNVPWLDITGNLFQIINTVFPGWNADVPAFDDTIPKLLRTIQVDDRYQIPNSPGIDCVVDVAECHPLIYVGGDAGVYRSFDLGQTWQQYPDVTIDNATLQGGYLPNAIVSDLDLATGPFDPVTGLTDFTQSLDILAATTFGRGTFAIRTSPLILSVSGSGVANAPDLLPADDTGVSNSDNITRNDGSPSAPLRFTGLTMRGASVDIFEEDDNGALRLVGTDLADPETGTWEVAIDPGVPLECGPHTIRAQATTFVGTKGPLSQPLIVSVLNERPIVSVGPDLLSVDPITGLTADDTFGVGTAGTNTDNLTRITTPRFTGTTVCGTSLEPVGQATVRLMVPTALPIPTVEGPIVVDPDTGISYTTLGTGVSLLDGTWTAQIAATTPLVPDGVYPISVRIEDLAGNVGMVFGPLNVTIDTVVSPAPTITGVIDDTCDPIATSPPCNPSPGFPTSQSDRITRDQTLFIRAMVETNSLVTLTQTGGPGIPGGPVLGSVLDGVGGDGTTDGIVLFDLTGITLSDGIYSFTVTAIDRAGNTSPASSPTTVIVDTTTPASTTPDLIDTDDSCAPPNSVFPTACSRGSHTDNITRVTTPTIRGRAEVGARVELLTDVAGFASLGTAIVGNDASDTAFGGTANDGLGLWTFTVGGVGSTTGPLNSGMQISVLYNVTAVATDLAGNVSGPSTALAMTIDTEPPVTPTIPPDLDPSSDTFPAPPPTIGTDTDDITRDNTPTFNGVNGSAEPDGLVTVVSRNLTTSVVTTLGTAPANSLGGWTFTVATGSAALTGPLADGRYSITYDNTDIAGNTSASSPPLSPLVIDTVIAAPSTPDLTAATDTCDPPSSVDPAPCDRGSHSDNITRTNTPSFTGTAEALGRVELFAGAVSLGLAAVVGNDASDVGIVPGATATDGKGFWTFTTNWSSILPIDGTYTITARATDQAGNTSAPSSGLQVVIDRTKPPASTIPDLSPSSDTGSSNSDNITRGNSPLFNGLVTLTGFADVGTTVRIFDNATCTGPAIGQVTPATSPNRLWTFNTATPLSEGTHSITASSTDSAGNESDCSPVLTVLIDTMIGQPSTPVLDPSSDSGLPPNGSNSDRITFDNTPTITGTVEANGTGIPQANTMLTVYDAGLAISSSFSAASSGAWSFTPVSPFTNGSHALTVIATDAAGNVSVASATLNIIVDTVIAIPVISRIEPDNGPSATDHVTNDGRLMFKGTAEPCTALPSPSVPAPPLGCTEVTLTRVGVGTFGVVYTDALGNWTFDNTANLLPPGNYSFTATARDAAGNVSATTAAFNVTIDTTSPTIDTAPSLDLADDTGLIGDLTTKVRRPRLTGMVFDNLPSVQVQIFLDADVQANDFSDPLGTATAAANGTYSVQVDVAHTLADGTYPVRILATDAAGNAQISPSLTFTVNTVPPNVAFVCTPTDSSACPTGTVTSPTGQIVVTFNGTDLNVCPSAIGPVAECGTNPANAFAGSVLNPANYTLVGTTRGEFNLNTSQFIVSPGAGGTSVLTINLRDASGDPIPLPNDTWTLTINGTTSAQDIAGNKLDGEVPGRVRDINGNCLATVSSGLPSGNCIEGGNFVRTFTVSVPPPTVLNAIASGTRKVITEVIITFSDAMNRTIAETDANYEIRDSGKDRRFDTRDDKIIGLASADCNPLPADCTQVTIKAIKSFTRKRPVRLLVRDTLVDLGGNRLDGNGDGQPGGNYTKVFGPGVAAVTAEVETQAVDRMLETGDSPIDWIVDELLGSRSRRGRWNA
jgi:subtilisin-like proprotein convertase family protein